MHVTATYPLASTPSPPPRLLRPLGTIARVVAGTGLIVVSIAGHGLAAWDGVGALVVLPTIAVALDRLLRDGISLISRVTGRFHSSVARTWAVHSGVLVLILAIATALTFVSPIDASAIWLFFGVSFLILALRGDAGCEALAVANAIFGRRAETGCVAFFALDSLEARSLAPASRPPAKAR